MTALQFDRTSGGCITPRINDLKSRLIHVQVRQRHAPQQDHAATQALVGDAERARPPPPLHSNLKWLLTYSSQVPVSVRLTDVAATAKAAAAGGLESRSYVGMRNGRMTVGPSPREVLLVFTDASGFVWIRDSSGFLMFHEKARLAS